MATCAVLAVTAAAQTPQRYTFGVQLAYLHASLPGVYAAAQIITPEGEQPEVVYGDVGGDGYYGFGVRFTANLAKRLGLDAAVNFLPSRGPAEYNYGFDVIGIGPRLRLDSSRRFGVYVYLRPTWLWQVGSGSEPTSTPAGPGPLLRYSFASDYLAFNWGATLEFNVSRHWLARLDIGDLWITGSQCGDCIGGGGGGLPANNLQTSLGLAYRF